MGTLHDMPSLPVSAEELRALIGELSERLEALEADDAVGSVEPSLPGFTDEKLATIAASIFRARRRRAKLFAASLFSEPAWDMLLELFVGSIRERPVTASGLCRAADVCEATGQRWIEMLEAQGLVRRRSVSEDGELRLVEISDGGFESMRQYVLEGVTKFEMPLPD
jgi:hypothetical protein